MSVICRVDTSTKTAGDEASRAAIVEFLAAHGIGPMGFIQDTDLNVVRTEKGFIVDTWQVVGDDARTAPMCETCPCCIQQRRVSVPLAAAVPLVGTSWVKRDFPVLTVRPGDAPPPDGFALGEALPVAVP